MTELKTLKDFENQGLIGCSVHKDCIYNSGDSHTDEEIKRLKRIQKQVLEKVRNEAIKWIKEMKKCQETMDVPDGYEESLFYANQFDDFSAREMDGNVCLPTYFGNVIDFIQYFFNITEEDLK